MHNQTEIPTRGGKREGAGRPSEGKKTYPVSLTETNVTRAKELAGNFSGLMDDLLAKWLKRQPSA